MKRRTRMFSWTFAIASLLFIGCADKENPSSPTVPAQSGLMPLGIGYSWTYQITENASDTLHMQIDTVRWSIIAAMTIQNEEWYEYSRTTAMGWEFYCNRPSGLWRRVRNDFATSISDPIFEAKYPAVSGEYFSDRHDDRILVASVDKQLEVPAGTFLCNEYVDADTSHLVTPPYISRCHRYYSPEVGLIRMEFFSRAIDGRDLLSTTWVLLSYSQ
jgi:hypothetical protein